MPVRLSAKDGPRELRAAVLALKAADKDLRLDINKRVRDTMNPVWRQGLGQRVSWFPEQTVTKGSRIAAGNPPTLVAGNSKRRIGQGLIPTEHWTAFEYGGNRAAVTTYTRRSANGGTHQVTRRTKAQLRPRNRSGYIIGPTLADTLPRMTSLFVQSVVRSVMDALDRRR